eukprot:PhF_6_TR42835/c0_g1_i3/m.64871
MADTVFFDDDGAVDDWEALAADDEDEVKPEQQQQTAKPKPVATKEEIVVKLANDDDDDADTYQLRLKLAEKWSDMQNVSGRNVSLLHERTPTTPEERTALYQDIAKLVQSNRKQTKHFGALLESYIKKAVGDALESAKAQEVGKADPTVEALKAMLTAKQNALPPPP